MFLDTGLTDLPWTGRSELLWLGLADDTGRQWSAICTDTDDGQCSDFVGTQVVPLIPIHEPRLGRAELADAAVAFCGEVHEFWAWFPSETDMVGLGVNPAFVVEMMQQFADWDYQLLRTLAADPDTTWPTR